ncbi:predicted nucleotidyltransferase [Serpentinimonas raichei]|jgi:predicted nucleotidyltransferase|uniref:Predicted nucleotidyltransferase n=1 Tax=Serpentinimonas raichei TaxID=1458425 RepID=A0A060NR68_9BURK|nr:nucleotidyltransferase domain-containing protein [Serpentinimonas raichei]BAO81384.1 predicted nucleotidyltransferase [Serpentinimonas raichei]
MSRLDPNTEAAVRRFLALIASRYDMAGAIVYGSRARGTHRPDSDADVAVLLRGPHQRLLSTKLDMADAAFDAMLDSGILVSPLPVWLDEWENPGLHSNPSLLQRIDNEGVRL